MIYSFLMLEYCLHDVIHWKIRVFKFVLWNVFVILTIQSTFSGGIICRLRTTIITTFLEKQPLLQS